MAFVMFDVFTGRPLGLNGRVAEMLAASLDSSDETELAGRVRYGLAKAALVQLTEPERVIVADLLKGFIGGGETEETARILEEALRVRIAGGDIGIAFFESNG